MNLDKTITKVSQPTIMIVEDDALIAADLTNQLEGWGYRVSAAMTSAEEALNALEESRPDLILMDIVLEGRMDGIEAAETIKEKWGIPIVFLTAYAETERLQRAKLTCPYGYIVKPCQKQDLKITVEMALYVGNVDATKRRAEEALRESNATLRAFIDCSPLAIITMDPEGNVTQWNPSARRIFGWPEHQVLGQFLPIVPEDQWEAHRLMRTRIMRGDAIKDVEVRCRKKDGSPIDICMSTAPLYDSRGQIKGIISMNADIGECKWAGETLAARLRLMQFSANHTLEEVLIATLDEAEALTDSRAGFYHFVAPDQKTISLQAWSTRTTSEMCQAVGKGMQYDIAKAGVWADGLYTRQVVIHNDYASLPNKKGLPPGHVPVIRELVVPIFRQDRIVAILGVGNKPSPYNDSDVRVTTLLADLAWEIVEHRRAEAALRLSEERYRDLVEGTDNLVTQVDAQGRFTFVNHMAQKVFGLSPEQCLGLSAFDFIHPDDRERTSLAFAGWLRDKPTSITIENRQVSRDGQVRLMLWTSNPHYDQNGELVLINGIARDITDRKQAELERESLICELQVLNREVHHRIKNNFQVLISLLNMQLRKEKDSTLRNSIQEIQGRLRAMALVNEELHQGKSLAKIDLGKYTERLSQSIFESASWRSRGLSLVINTPAGLIVVPEQAVPIGLILNELLTNSIKYAFPEGRSGEISVRVNSGDQNKLELWVSDNGVGLPPHIDWKTTDTLGLSLVKLLTESQLKGSLEVQRGPGTQFRIVF